MKLRNGLMGVGAALALALVAQSAQAQSCNSGGGGGDVIEMAPDDQLPCEPIGGGSAPLITEATNANGIVYEVQATLPEGNDYLQIGEVVEVTVDYEDVMASLRANEKDAIALAASLGMRSIEKGGVVKASHKLTDAEYNALATYVHVAAQSAGRSTGRSNPAGDSFTRRVDAAAQAFGRAMDAIGRNIPSFNGFMTVRTFHPNGQMRTEVVIGAEVRRQ